MYFLDLQIRVNYNNNNNNKTPETRCKYKKYIK